jgi:hypothetical protein
MAASLPTHTDKPHGPFPCAQQDWEHTPSAVQEHLFTLQHRVDQLQHQLATLPGQLSTTSPTSSTPPSSDSPCTQKRERHPSSGTRGARTGHPGSGPPLLAPTEVHQVYPASCACGQGGRVSPTPSHTQQGIELPPLDLHMTHCVLHQARGVGCGQRRQAAIPSAPVSGSGPRWPALSGARGGMHRTSRRRVHAFCHSGVPLPISLGAVPKVLDRASHALGPH